MITVNGILLLYRRYLNEDANTIIEHVNSFEKYSHYKVWAINVAYGFPKELNRYYFSIIVFHYSFFFSYSLGKFKEFLEANSSSYKIAFFQDEHHNCKKRFEFINIYQIDCIFSLIEAEYYEKIYKKYCNVSKIIHYIPGYVSDDLIKCANLMYIPDNMRGIDIGYRGRPTPYTWGKGSQEKTEIGKQFLERSKNLNLKLDIEIEEKSRLYGNSWNTFIANCKGMLAVESGVSIFDIEGKIFDNYQKYLGTTDYCTIIEKQSHINFQKVAKDLDFDTYEGNVYYRTISPRHFEAAAFRVCQILYEGQYSGILKPMIHYLPLKKDFSNFHDIIQLFQDPNIRQRITDNAYSDLIMSGKYSYKQFFKSFDKLLIENGLSMTNNENLEKKVTKSLILGTNRRYVVTKFKNVIGKYLFY